MRNFFSLVFFIILSVSCNNNQDKNYKKTIKTEHKKKIKESDLDYFQLKLSKKEVEKISLNVKSDLGYKDIVLKGIEQLCGQTTYESIDSLYINYLEQINIIDYGKTLVFETQIFGNLPFSSPTHYYVFYNTKRAEICIFPFSRLYLFKTRNEHKQSFFGGVEIRKNVGFFNVFSFDGQKFSECLKKNVLVPVFLKNSECIQIENGFLEFKNTDIDNNGLLDIVFSGEIDYYCKPEEYGVDVSKRNPLKKDFVNVKFFYDENHKIWYCSNEKEVKRKFNL